MEEIDKFYQSAGSLMFVVPMLIFVLLCYLFLIIAKPENPKQ